MADHPLRPATDRRLGRPLPHQLPNRTQAAPKAHYCFVPQDICGISPSFPGLSPTSGHIPTRYSPVRRSPCEARDLHVLSMPPAFTLSQDQTLRFIHHQIPKDPAAPNRPALTLLTDVSQPSQDHQTPSQITPKTSAPHGNQHPGADRASHPSHQQHLPAPPAPRQKPQPSLSPAPSHPLRTAKNQTLPKPMHLSKNNTRSTRDNLRGGHHPPIQRNPASSAGQRT